MLSEHLIWVSLVAFISMGRVWSSQVLTNDEDRNRFSAPMPSPCRYEPTSQGLKADCTRRGLSSVPANLPEDVTKLDLTGNMIKVLTNTSFKGVPRLVNLTLSTNKIDVIEVGAFYPLLEMKQIVLGSNSLTVLHKDLFSNNLYLENVDLSYNHFLSYPGDVLNPMGSLKVVNLIHNNITSVNFTNFTSRNISIMTFALNQISSFHEDDFYPLWDIEIDKISFTSNKLTALPDCVFRYLNKVKILHLPNNKIGNFSIYPFLGMTSLEELDMKVNNITTIIPFNNVPNTNMDIPPLKVLTMLGNNFSSVPVGAFQGLAKLVYLDIHQCRIIHLQNNSFLGLTSLQTLDLTGNFINDVNKAMFTVLPNLQSLILNSNHLKLFSPLQFGGLKSLTALRVSRNSIAKIDTGRWDLPSLETLDLSHNRLEGINKYSFSGMTNLTNLVLANNRYLTSIENKAFQTNDELQVLDLSSLSSLGSVTSPFENLKRLATMDLSNTAVALRYQFFTGLSNLEKLILDNSQLTANSLWDSRLDVPVLSSLSNLKKLYMGSNHLDGMHQGTFKNLDNLQYLKMQNSRITSLDKGIFHNLTALLYLYIDMNTIQYLLPEQLSHLTSLVGVSIKNNQIKQIDEDLFERNEHLSFLYISGNSLTTIKEGTILPKAILDISGNPLTCTCDLKWFAKWLHEDHVSLIHPNQTICSNVSLAHFRNQTILTFNPEEVCGPNITFYVLISVLLSALLMGSLLTYHKRWWINYKCFHLKLMFIGYTEVHDERERLNYEYDINLMFDDKDESWVRRVFKPVLEEKLPDFNRVVCGDDELPLGMYYINAIIEVVENSFKTVLIVSSAAVEDHAFINKLRLAVEHMNDVELEKVILIFKEDIPDDRLPYLVRLFLSKNKPYFLWTEDTYGQRLFWDKVAKDLKCNKAMNDIIPI